MRIKSDCSRGQLDRALSQWEDTMLSKHLDEDEDDNPIDEDFDEEDFNEEDDFEEVEGDEVSEEE